jgi:cation transport ATPase
MVYCPHCGKKNEDDAPFCTSCGTSLNIHAKDTALKRHADDFAQTAEKLGKKAGKKIEQAATRFGEETKGAGKRFEKKMDKAGKGFENWYDRTFGIAGPLISSFLGLIVLRLVIGGMDLAADDLPLLGTLSAFLYTYFLVFFGLMLLSSYSSYFSRHYKHQFRWILPGISAVGLTVVLWITASLLVILDEALDILALVWIALFIETYIIAIFVFILLVAYLILSFTVFMEQNIQR